MGIFNKKINSNKNEPEINVNKAVIIPWGFQFKKEENIYCMSGEIIIIDALEDLEKSYLRSLKYIQENGCYNPKENYTIIHQKCKDVFQSYAEKLSEEELKSNSSDMIALRKKILGNDNQALIQELSDVFVINGVKHIGENLTEDNIIIYNCDVMTQKEEH